MNRLLFDVPNVSDWVSKNSKYLWEAFSFGSFPTTEKYKNIEGPFPSKPFTIFKVLDRFFSLLKIWLR